MSETVLITGCSSGIGRATARAFLEDDWTVYATARDPDDVTDLADLGCETTRLDVTDPEQCKAAVEAVVDERGRIDCLVNNAGYGQLGAVEDVSTRRLHRQFDVNVYGPHRLIRRALPYMRESGEGTVINVSSTAGRIAVPGMGAYCASKFALEALSDALRPEVSPFGVDVVLVEPGPVDTRFDDRAVAEADELEWSEPYRRIYEFYEDRRSVADIGSIPPRDVAEAVLNAANVTDPEARYAVGSVSRLAKVARLLPDGLRDAAFGFATKLSR